MSQNNTAIILDVGATNVRAVAVDETGNIIAQSYYPNKTQSDPYFQGGLIWDVDEIWEKLTKATSEIIQKTGTKNIVAVTVTTFGVDFTPVLKSGQLLYPVISWACNRTESVMEYIDKYIPLKKLYSISGINKFSFNTINKLVWFKENRPDILDKADHFAFISSILLHKLTGKFVTEITMAGTSMLTDHKTRDFSQEVFKSIRVENKFPEMIESGQVMGYVTKVVAAKTGIPPGIPVVAAGHDTQFAIFGSGAGINEPVLSSGTWEILMVRTPNIQLDDKAFKAGITTEFDAIPDIYNPGIQWLGSGILEWIKMSFYADVMNNPDIYDVMIGDAEAVGDSTVEVNLGFLSGQGGINNLNINTQRGEIYKATLNALSQQTKTGLKLLEQSCGFKAKSLLVVGGGAKNRLWNELRANALGLPVKTVTQTETTVLGAAMFAFAGSGGFGSVGEVRRRFVK